MTWLSAGRAVRAHAPPALVLTLFAWIALATAWLADDSFISLRQVLNAIDGEGFTWNYGQRVQAFTHPAWVLLLTAAAAVTRELFVTTIVLSIALSLASVVWAMRYGLSAPPGAARPLLVYAFLVVLAFSKAFTDYMTSGLENALSFCLVGFALWQMRLLQTDANGSRRRMLVVAALTLAVLNRLDLVLLVAPLAAWTLSGAPARAALKAALPGVLLVAAWLVFATVYFGSPLPNTYYAKLAAGYPAGELHARGGAYFSATLAHDPVTAVLVLLGVVAGLSAASWLNRSLALGMLLYGAYIFAIGGDFMEGRFFAILAYAGVFNIVSLDERRTPLVVLKAATFVAAAAAVTMGPSPILSDRSYRNLVFTDDIADERGVWYERFGLLSPGRDWPQPGVRPSGPPVAYQATCAGVDPLVHRDVLWIDICALGDPLLARLPAIRSRDWRIGHPFRKVPTDYGDVLTGRVAGLHDSDLEELFDDVQLVTTGTLWSVDRARAIVRLNLGPAYGFDHEHYADPHAVIPASSAATEVEYERFNQERAADGAEWLRPVVEGVVWPQPNAATMFSATLSIHLRTPLSARFLSISVDGNDAYRLVVNDGELDVRIDPSPHAGPWDGLVNHHIELSGRRLIRVIRIEAVAGDGYYAVGHLLLEAGEER